MQRGTTNYKYNVGGTPTDISGLFNKTGAAFDVTIGGTVTYNGAGQTATISSYSPTDVSAPSISGTVTNSGSYGTGSFTIGLPGNYAAGTYGGTFTINKRTGLSLSASNYFYDPFAQFWGVYEMTISGGIANGPYDGFTIVCFSNCTSTDFPYTVPNGNFNGSGNIIITFPGGKLVNQSNPGSGTMRLTTSSTNYTGSYNASLLEIV